MSIDPGKTSAPAPAVSSIQVNQTVRLVVGYVATNAMTWLTAKGLITPSDAPALADALAVAAVSIIGAMHVAYAAYASRPKALVAAVQAQPNMQVLTTDPKIAAAVPDVHLVNKV